MVADAQVGVSIQDRLFMTATTVKDVQDHVYSMDDKVVYGEILKLSTSEAIKAGLNKPFKVTAFSFNTCGCVSDDRQVT
jgi:predicted helicase